MRRNIYFQCNLSNGDRKRLTIAVWPATYIAASSPSKLLLKVAAETINFLKVNHERYNVPSDGMSSPLLLIFWYKFRFWRSRYPSRNNLRYDDEELVKLRSALMTLIRMTAKTPSDRPYVTVISIADTCLTLFSSVCYRPGYTAISDESNNQSHLTS